MSERINAQFKFPVFSQYLDFTLGGELDLIPNETMEQGWERIYQRAKAFASSKREEAQSEKEKIIKEVNDSIHNAFPPIDPPMPTPIIDKSWEKIEIAIDNCTTIEELATFKHNLPNQLMANYMQKLKQLTNVQ